MGVSQARKKARPISVWSAGVTGCRVWQGHETVGRKELRREHGGRARRAAK